MIFRTSARPKRNTLPVSLRNFLVIVALLISGLLFPSCGIINKRGYTKVVKPIKHSKPYNPKKNRQAKRTKTVWRKIGY